MTTAIATLDQDRVERSSSSSALRVEVDQVTPAAWPRILDLFADANIYQTFSYGAIRWGAKNLSHLVLKRNDEVVGIAQLRIVQPTSLKFGMAYLRWGPICHRRGSELDAAVLRRMAEALHEEYVVRRRLLLQVIPNAFVGSTRAELFESAFSKFLQEAPGPANTYRTFVLDLSPSLEELRGNLDKKWRNQLTRSEKNGLKVIASRGIEAYQTFCRTYKQMRSRKTFDTSVDVEEFARIQEQLAESQRMRILLCEQGGGPVAGLVASAMGDSAIYLLGATGDDGLNAKGSYLLQWTLIQWLKQDGIRWYDLGGIDPEKNPGVYHFKKGFSGTDVCQLRPFVACNSPLSSVSVKASLTVSRVVRRLKAYNSGRTVQSAT
ncbi:MAG TPA: peptidoglycan bridge formation glycyltransferase FemA/FemB family protein [Terriglobales bacterium]|nr:peptidoglycan bridge formation glycyltransferase FemA/FemB family protein [Terriglobales bacterium]